MFLIILIDIYHRLGTWFDIATGLLAELFNGHWLRDHYFVFVLVEVDVEDAARLGQTKFASHIDWQCGLTFAGDSNGRFHIYYFSKLHYFLQ